MICFMLTWHLSVGAWGGIITQPLAMTFGKRGAFIASTLLLTVRHRALLLRRVKVDVQVCTAVTPFATTRSTWYGSLTAQPQMVLKVRRIGIQIVKGFVASAAEMLPEVRIRDTGLGLRSSTS